VPCSPTTSCACRHPGRDEPPQEGRLLKVAEDSKLPIVLFRRGRRRPAGRHRFPWRRGPRHATFRQYAKLSGSVPRIGINSGRCFAAMPPCSARATSSSPQPIPTSAWVDRNDRRRRPRRLCAGGCRSDVGAVPNGVVDIAVADEAEAVAAAKKYLSYFQGAIPAWDSADQRMLRHLIPENRLRVYDIRTVIAALADTNSVLELRPEFAPGMITALVRIEGHPFGLIANNPMHLAGAIDAPCADKAARLLQLCDAFGLPVVSLCDTPGFMVGPEAEKASLVRARRACSWLAAR